MHVGDPVQRQAGLSKRGGSPLSPRTKAGYLTATRTFFRDVQEWEWIPQKFNPARALATPRSIQALIGPNPRVIADDVWAKLLWAGLNLQPEDCPTNTYGLCYPMEMIRAIRLAWLFSGLRSDEIARQSPDQVGSARLRATPVLARSRIPPGHYRTNRAGVRRGEPAAVKYAASPVSSNWSHHGSRCVIRSSERL